MDRSGLLYFLALSRVRGVKRPLIKGLLDRVLKEGLDLKDLFKDPCGLPSSLSGALKGFSDWKAVERELDLVEKKGVEVITYTDGRYPALLREIYDPPVLLYTRGAFYPGSMPAVSVVGTRRPSSYGLRMSEMMARDLAAMGVVVVSGMARGCDTAAHRGALSAGGRTVAVLGSGVDVVYPPENRTLYNEIIEKGLVLSEYPMGTPPNPYNFPRRNRIISGFSMGVLVVEAPLRSGAMGTARLALEENREVFALPGPADSPKAEGTNSLIREGAVLVNRAEDIMAELNIKPSSPRPRRRGAAPPDSDEEIILRLMDEGPLHIDAIIEKTGLPPGRISSMLLDMELKGFIEQRPGKIFMRGHG